MRTLTLRGLAAHKRRLASTVVAVVLGVGFMAGSLIVTDTMKATLAGAQAEAEQGTDALVRGPATIDVGFGMGHRPVDADLAERVAAVPGVAFVAPRVEGFAQVLGRDGKPIDDLSMGAAPTGAAWTEAAELNPFRLSAGHGPEHADEVVVDRSIADDAGLSLGDPATVLTGSAPRRVVVVGIATFGGQDNRAGARTVLFTPDTAQQLFGSNGRVDAIAVAADGGVSQDALVRRLDAVLPAHAEAITGQDLLAEIADRKNMDVAFFSMFMRVFAVVALLVGAFIINNTFTILVAQRTRELALLRAVGASRGQVRRAVALEAAVVGAVASALGLLAGMGVAFGIQRLFDAFGLALPQGQLVVAGGSLITAFVVGFVVTVGSALLPARRAARVAPVAALQSVAAEPRGTSRVRVGLGLLLTLASAVAVVVGITGGEVPPVLLGALGSFLGVATLAPVLARPVVRALGGVLPRTAGVRGLMARENAARNPRRTAATASALMIGVALVGSVTCFAASGKWSVSHSFDQEFRGDLVVDSGAWTFGGVSPELSDDLGARPELAAVAAKQLTEARVAGSLTELAGWPAATVGEVFDLGVSSGSLNAMGEDGIAVGSAWARQHDVRLGSRVPVTFVGGTEQTFVVRAVFEHPDWTGRVWVDRAAFGDAVPGALDTQVYVRAADGADSAAVRAAVDDAASAYRNATVQDRDELKAAVEKEFDTILGFVYALLALAIGIALLGIANTVALSVVERTRELGLLRAVGMSRGHLRGMVRWEAALVAVFGTVTGLAVGLFLGWSMVFAISQEVETARFVVPVGQLLVIVAVAGACGVLAALLPARRAARLDVLEALATT